MDIPVVLECQVQFGEETVLQIVEVPQFQFSLVIVQFLDQCCCRPSLCNDRERGQDRAGHCLEF